MITSTRHGFDVALPKGKLEVTNLASFPVPKYAHVILLQTGAQTLEVYVSATGRMRVFAKRMANGKRIMGTKEMVAR